jgi:hypothetical protein
MRIAQVAPLTEAVPPKLYGGTERIVHWLTEKLVALGHDVTLGIHKLPQSWMRPGRQRTARPRRAPDYRNIEGRLRNRLGGLDLQLRSDFNCPWFSAVPVPEN